MDIEGENGMKGKRSLFAVKVGKGHGFEVF